MLNQYKYRYPLLSPSPTLFWFGFVKKRTSSEYRASIDIIKLFVGNNHQQTPVCLFGSQKALRVENKREREWSISFILIGYLFKSFVSCHKVEKSTG